MAAAFGDLWNEAWGSWARARVALRAFGRLPLVAMLEWGDVLRSMRTGGGEMADGLMSLRLAMRTLARTPAFTLTTIGLIGLGVGAVTTIFTLVDHVLLRPLPYPDAERLVTVQEGAFPGVVFRALDEAGSTDAWAAGFGDEARLTGEGDPVRVTQARVSAGFFPLLGARPEVGRLFSDGDFDATDVAVLAFDTWRNVFGEDPEIVGRTIRIDGQSIEVIGVLGASFESPPNVVSSVDVWRPSDFTTGIFDDPGYFTLQFVGRLRPGASLADLQSELDAIAQRVSDQHPDNLKDREGNPIEMPAIGLQDATVESVRTGLGLLLGAVSLLLLVACLNVAHLFLARGLGRSREMAIRRALGAASGVVAMQLLVESVVVGLVGGALGLGLASIGIRGYLGLNPDAVPRASTVGLDMRVLLFAAAVSVLTSVVFGLLPALRSVGEDLTRGLKGSSQSVTSSRGTKRLRNVLVVVEVALSLVLIGQAGLLLKSYLGTQRTDPGFDPAGIWTIPLTPTGLETPAAYLAAMDDVRDALAGLPGVSSATYGLTQPFEFTGRGRCCWSQTRPMVDGEERTGVRVMLQPITREYFETLGIGILAGSVWTAEREAERPVPTVITEQLAVDLFGSTDVAMGRTFGDPERMELRVVGIAADTRHYGLDQPMPAAAYVPMSIVPFTIPLAHMAVHLEGEAPAGLVRTLREAVWRASPDLPVPTVRSMDEWIGLSVAGRRFDSVLFAAFGSVALLLAAAGLYGTLLYTVRQQSRELGIRMALGAARSRVQSEVVRRGVTLALIGAAVGVVGSWRAGIALESRLYEVQASDPVALGASVALLVAVAALASWLPARRAGRTDPIETLKAE
jgi:predicted permease